jgi:hypothetical protein
VTSVAAPAVARPLWRWAYLAASARDLRLDLIRGFLVFAMIVDHIGGASFLYGITGGNNFFISAAEGFLFVSGMVMGVVYLRILQKNGIGQTLRRAFRRGLTLYALNVVLTLVFATLSWGLSAWWADAIDDPFRFLIGVLLLDRTFYLADIIHLYAVLLLLSPILLWMCWRGLGWLVLLISLSVWAGFQAFPQFMPAPGAGTAFPLSGWQVFFVIGIVVGWHRTAIEGVLARIGWPIVTAVLAVLALILVQLYRTDGQLFLQLSNAPLWSAFVDSFWNKYGAGAGRLVSCVVFFPLVLIAVTLVWQPLVRSLGWLLLPMGQNALYAYTMHLFIVLIVSAVLGQHPPFNLDLPAVNTVLQLAGVALLWLMIRQRFLFSVVPR